MGGLRKPGGVRPRPSLPRQPARLGGPTLTLPRQYRPFAPPPQPHPTPPAAQVDQYATVDTNSVMVTFRGRWGAACCLPALPGPAS